MTSDKPPYGAQPLSSAEPPAAIRPMHRRPNRVVLHADVAADGRRNLSVEREGDDVARPPNPAESDAHARWRHCEHKEMQDSLALAVNPIVGLGEVSPSHGSTGAIAAEP